MQAMILAAGRGERLRPVTDRVPKALVEVRGESLLERHLRALAGAGVDSVVINLGWLGEQIVERIGGGSAYGLRVAYSPEYDNILDTGGGIRRALPLFGDQPFWVINADIFTDFDFAAADVDIACDAHLVLVPTPDYKPAGDFDLQAGKVVNGSEPGLTYSGIARYRASFFAGTEPGRFSIVPMLREAADQGCLDGSLYSGAWADVGTPRRLDALNGQS
jgi:MurNAc alpha-1-phosphate uridylyltransferase